MFGSSMEMSDIQAMKTCIVVDQFVYRDQIFATITQGLSSNPQ